MQNPEKGTSAIDEVARRLTLKTSVYVAGSLVSAWALWNVREYTAWPLLAVHLQLPNIPVWEELQLPEFLHHLRSQDMEFQLVAFAISTAASFLMISIGGSLAWRSIRRQLISSLNLSDPATTSVFAFAASIRLNNPVAESADGDSRLFGNENTDQINAVRRSSLSSETRSLVTTRATPSRRGLVAKSGGDLPISDYSDIDVRRRENRIRRSWTIRKPLGIGLASIVALFGGVGAWATTVNISGAVLGKGQVQASATRIAVQHPVGGVVAEILANDADKVKSGDVVLRLDDSMLRSDLATVEAELFEILANEARLQAEIDDRKELSLDPILKEAIKTNAGLKPLLARLQRQLEASRESLATQVSLLQERINQIRDEALGTQAALDAKREGLEFAQKELAAGLQNLEKGIITKQIVVPLQREVIVLKGEVGSLTAKLAELKGKQAEQQLASYAVPLTARALNSDKLNLLKQQGNKLIETRNSILYKLGKLDVRAPVSGMVFDSKVLGPRSVVEAAKPIMYIVPDSQRTLVSVRVEARDIDQVHVGQEAGLRFTTFNRRSTPMIEGRVTAVSADALLDPVTHSFYYFVEVVLGQDELRKLGHELIPGMPVEAFLATDGRSPASYAVKPIADYFTRAFRD
jgi:HlyD family secretion protein